MIGYNGTFPYLEFSRRFRCDYGSVLRAADTIEAFLKSPTREHRALPQFEKLSAVQAHDLARVVLEEQTRRRGR